MMFYLLNILVVTVINFPKIDIVGFPGVSQGVRLDDILVSFIFIMVLISEKQKKAPKVLVVLMLYLVFSTLLGVLIHPGHDFIRIAYIIRVLEYGIFAFSLYHLRSYINVSKVTLYTVIFQFTCVFIQIAMGKERPSGTFNGPWELVTVVGVLLLSLPYFKDGKSSRGKINSYFVFIISALTKSRSATLGILFTIISFDKNVRKYFPIFIFIIPAFLFSIFKFGDVEWINSVFKPENINLVSQFVNYSITSTQYSMSESLYNEYSDLGDASLAMRLGIWLNLISLFSQSEWFFLKYMFGIGLGANGIVIDGFYIRLIFELGIFGVIFYFILMYKIWQIKEFRRLVVFLFFTCLTLDPYTSSKVSYAIGLIYAAYKR